MSHFLADERIARYVDDRYSLKARFICNAYSVRLSVKCL